MSENTDCRGFHEKTFLGPGASFGGGYLFGAANRGTTLVNSKLRFVMLHSEL
jgi:hypothetical protein